MHKKYKRARFIRYYTQMKKRGVPIIAPILSKRDFQSALSVPMSSEIMRDKPPGSSWPTVIVCQCHACSLYSSRLLVSSLSSFPHPPFPPSTCTHTEVAPPRLEPAVWWKTGASKPQQVDPVNVPQPLHTCYHCNPSVMFVFALSAFILVFVSLDTGRQHFLGW